jgi:hypothetical protein
VDGIADVRALLNLQGFPCRDHHHHALRRALVVERHEAIQEIEEWRYRHERVIRASGSLLYDMDPVSGFVVWDGDVESVPRHLRRAREHRSAQWMLRVHPDDRTAAEGIARAALHRPAVARRPRVSLPQATTASTPRSA